MKRGKVVVWDGIVPGCNCVFCSGGLASGEHKKRGERKR